MRLLFLHGAGGYVEDQALAHGIAESLDAEVDLPHLPDEDLSFEGWAAPVRDALAAVRPEDAVVAHSFGASILLRVLAEQEWPVARAVLLGMPDWSAAGWGVADYAFAGPAPATGLSLHHCRDDEIVPFEHLALHAAVLPAALLHEHEVGGHQFTGLHEVVASDAGAGRSRSAT